MSTIKKLDPMIRAAHSRRRSVVRHLEAMATTLTGDAKFKLTAIVAQLRKIQRDSAADNATKEAAFRLVLDANTGTFGALPAE